MNLHRLFIVSLVAVSPALAGVLYDNGPWDGTTAIDIVYPEFSALSDSFVLTSDAIVTGFNFVSLGEPGDSISTVSWSITSGPVNTPSSGTLYGSAAGATVVKTPICAGCALGYYDENTNSVSDLDLSLTAGTYYLNLFSAVAANFPAWAISDGSSAAYYGGGNLANVYTAGTDSEAFQILGSPRESPTPEPSSVILFGPGIAILAMRRRHKPSRTVFC